MVNNAGATIHLGDLADTPVEVIRQVVDLNLTAAIYVARRAVRDLGEGGVLVNVSSAAATLGSPHEYVHYAAAKAGVDALTHGLAQEVAGRGIRVNGVAPGIVRTGIHADAGEPDRLERVGPLVPLGRVGEPEEVAEAIAWLLSDACPYVTGATLRVAGGRGSVGEAGQRAEQDRPERHRRLELAEHADAAGEGAVDEHVRRRQVQPQHRGVRVSTGVVDAAELSCIHERENWNSSTLAGSRNGPR